MMTHITLQLHGIVCVASRSIDGDRVSVVINDQVVWSLRSVRLHAKHRSVVDFDNGTIRGAGGIEALPEYAPEQFNWNCTQFPTIIQLDVIGWFHGRHTVGRIVLQREAVNSGRIQERRLGAGADYFLAYSLTQSIT